MLKKIYVLILAAGQSRRLGQPKQLLPYKNGTLISHTIAVAEEVIPGQSSIILGAYADSIYKEISKIGVPVFTNPNWKNGLGNSIAYGMTKIPNDAEGVVIVLADQPFLTSEILRSLIDQCQKSEEQIVLCKYDQGQGPPTYFPKKYFNDLLALDDDDGAKPVVKKWREKVRLISFPLGHLDIDRPEDLGRLD